MKSIHKPLDRFVSLLAFRDHGRIAASSLAGLAVLTGIANAQAPSPPQFGPQPINQIGRFLGYGSSDGYQACKPSEGWFHVGIHRPSVPNVQGVNAIRPRFGGTSEPAECHDCQKISGLLSRFMGNATAAIGGLTPQPMVLPYAAHSHFGSSPIYPGSLPVTTPMPMPMPMSGPMSGPMPASPLQPRLPAEPMTRPGFTGNQSFIGTESRERSILQQAEPSPSDLPISEAIDTDGSVLEKGLRLPESDSSDSKPDPAQSTEADLLDKQSLDEQSVVPNSGRNPSIAAPSSSSSEQATSSDAGLLLPVAPKSDLPAVLERNSDLPRDDADRSLPRGEGTAPPKVEGSQEDDDLLTRRLFRGPRVSNAYHQHSASVREFQAWMVSQRKPVHSVPSNLSRRLQELPPSRRPVSVAPQLPRSAAETDSKNPLPGVDTQSPDRSGTEAAEPAKTGVDWFSADKPNAPSVSNVGFYESSERSSSSFIVQPSRRNSGGPNHRSPQ